LSSSSSAKVGPMGEISSIEPAPPGMSITWKLRLGDGCNNGEDRRGDFSGVDGVSLVAGNVKAVPSSPASNAPQLVSLTGGGGCCPGG
jgi:hypothetical protein